jgi:pimeloyl-ACP methyl ester carboxylesterase
MPEIPARPSQCADLRGCPPRERLQRGRTLLAHALLSLLVVLGGCAAPLTIERLTPRAAYREVNRSALSSNTLSDSTENVLRAHGLNEAWDNHPAETIAVLRQAVVASPDDWQALFALSEMSYWQAIHAQSRQDFLAAAIYAYAYLFPGLGQADPNPYDPRFRQACDIYNLSLTAAFTPDEGGPVRLASGSRPLPYGEAELTVDPSDQRWGDRTLVSFEPTSNLRVRGLQNVYRSPGLGAPLAAISDADAHAVQGFQVAPRLRVPTNMLLVIDAPRQQIAQPVVHGRLLIHNLFDTLDMTIDNTRVPLEYDRTTTEAVSLVESSAWLGEYSGFLNGTLVNKRSAQLVALEPHRHGRMPVVFIHGTASSPFRWADMANDLLEDPVIRDNFEFWFFSYGTGNPIPFSALQLRQDIEAAVQKLGGTGADPALGRITLVGHSQGGLLAKMLVIDPGSRLWDGIVRRPLDQVQMSEQSRQLLREMLFPRPMPDVDRVIFVATPQRGSFLAGFSVTGLLGRLVTMPIEITQTAKDVLTGNTDNILNDPDRTRIGSIYGMSPNSRFIQALAAVPVSPDVHAHSIIPVQTSGPVEQGDDGVVKYASAHITGVDSELVVRSGHSTQSTPATIAEVHRILLLQLAGARVAPAGQARPVASLQ